MLVFPLENSRGLPVERYFLFGLKGIHKRVVEKIKLNETCIKMPITNHLVS